MTFQYINKIEGLGNVLAEDKMLLGPVTHLVKAT